MKSLLLGLAIVLATPLLALGGGNSSIVEISKVTEITFDLEKITIKGSGIVKRRVMSTKEKGDDRVFGQPAQWLHAKVDEAVFEIVPYFTPGIVGVPTGGHSDEELQALSDKWWASTLKSAAKIQVGDQVRIGYQGDITTINGYQVTKMVGYGTASVTKEEE